VVDDGRTTRHLAREQALNGPLLSSLERSCNLQELVGGMVGEDWHGCCCSCSSNWRKVVIVTGFWRTCRGQTGCSLLTGLFLACLICLVVVGEVEELEGAAGRMYS
jgi:hypothetical protein